MGLQLRAEQSSVVKIFSSEAEFEIPDFQRPYSWEYSQCFQLYSDIFEMYYLGEEFFLGNIITAKSKDNDDILQIVDGQQRLTTLLLWIRALDLLYKEEFESTHGGLYKALYKEDWETSEFKTRLKSNIFETDDDKNLQPILSKDFVVNALLNKCFKDNKIDEKECSSKFERNFLYFYIWTKKDFKKDIKEFITYLLKSVMLLPIELEANTTEEAVGKALRIFETINNRGMDLEDSDIFKSKLHILASKQGEKDIFIDRWVELRESVESLGLKIDDIFRYYSHLIRAKEKIVSSEINLREFFTLKPYSPLKRSDSNYNEILDELYKIIEIYRFIDEIIASENQLSKWFSLINIYTNQYPKIALIIYLYKLSEDGINLEDFKNIKQSKINAIMAFCKSLIRYIYYMGATTTIKSEIYTVIRDVMWNQEIKDYCRDVKASEFDRLGRLKNGYALLGYYLQNEKTVINPKIDRVVTYKDQQEIDYSRIENVYDRLGNFFIIETKKRINRKYLDKISKYNDESTIFSKQIDIEKIETNPIDTILSRDKELKELIANFIKGLI